MLLLGWRLLEDFASLHLEELDVVEFLPWFWRTLSILWSLDYDALVLG